MYDRIESGNQDNLDHLRTPVNVGAKVSKSSQNSLN